MQEGKRKKHPTLIALIGTIVILLFSGCGGGSGGGGGVGNITGLVKDLNSVAVSNADVVIGTNSTKTLSNGTYTFTNIPSGNCIIKINAAGYTPAYRQVNLTAGSSVVADIAFLASLDSKITPVPSSGGTTTNTDGRMKMVFADGSFVAGTTHNIVLTAAPAIAAPYNSPSGQQFISYIIYAKPDDAIIDSGHKAIISIPNLTSVTTEAVAFYHFNPDQFQWESEGTGSASNETNTINCEVAIMGWIAAIIPINPAPGSISGNITDLSLSAVQGANVYTNSSYAVTDQYGYYLLTNIPPGTTEVNVTAVGYETPSPKFVDVVPYIPMTGVDFAMTSLVSSQGNITGIVKSDNGSPIANARVVESGGNQAFTDDIYGTYTLYNIDQGATTLTAYAANHISSSEIVTFTGGGTITAPDFILPEIAGGTKTYLFNFDTAGTLEGFNGGTSANMLKQWHIQRAETNTILNPKNHFNRGIPETEQTRKVKLPKFPDLSDDEYLPAAHSGNYYAWFGTGKEVPSVEGSYMGTQEAQDVLTTEEFTGGISYPLAIDKNLCGSFESPVMDLSGYINGTLSLWTWWEIEGKNPATKRDTKKNTDAMAIQIKKESDSNWSLIGYLNPYEDPSNLYQSGEAYTSGGYNKPGVWVKHNLDISAYVGQKIKIRFYFNTGDNLWNGYRGWILDDISITNQRFSEVSSMNRLKQYFPDSTN